MTGSKMVIERYFKQDNWGEKIKKDLRPLVKLINGSGGEYSLQLRENYFNIYYQGNSLAKVEPNRNGTYTATIHGRFLEGGTREKLAQYSFSQPSLKTGSQSNYLRFRVKAQDIHPFFQRKHLDRLSSEIHKVHAGEEITMEQVLITDNPPTPDFIIIDRQVADHLNKAQIDLLALIREPGEVAHHFVVIEVKLGRNPELREKVGRQLSGYVEHIRKHINDYVSCYEKNYFQKKDLGLLQEDMPDSIAIDNNPETVEGLIVVCGYSGLAKENIKCLKRAIEKNRWSISVHQTLMTLNLDQPIA